MTNTTLNLKTAPGYEVLAAAGKKMLLLKLINAINISVYLNLPIVCRVRRCGIFELSCRLLIATHPTVSGCGVEGGFI
ncbi:hypothetical protein [Tychonema sp. BBK16]|uniref:hypothetical protein n=1 Tax=Tychonema sp. BBK16 TaxID=2699888 RepID=UPI001F1FBC0C|nr:hypothetical protein [Tychonema sp. BBK16]MCF6374749.1 hypothetical protein [Tychonema sp. BBK16]